MKRFALCACLSLCCLSVALALPYVDGCLTPDNEYDGSLSGVYTGSYSKCYTRYVSGEGLYICNDWYNPDENFDPDGQCDGYNIFTWTDTAPNPDMYWRLMVPGNGGTPIVQNRPNTANSEWEDVSTSGFACDAGYHPSKNLSTPHPIWELLIPCSAISANIEVGMKDPKSIDPDNCPSGWDPPNYGDGPSGVTVPTPPCQ